MSIINIALMMSTEADNVLQHCDDLLHDIISFKGARRRSCTANGPGTDYPKAQEHTKGDDVWTFYRSVQTERISIEKVISNRIHTNSRQYNLENPLEYVLPIINTSSKYGKLQNPFRTCTQSRNSSAQVHLQYTFDRALGLNEVDLLILLQQYKLKLLLAIFVERDISLKFLRWTRSDWVMI